jgi:hypothetical protein
MHVPVVAAYVESKRSDDDATRTFGIPCMAAHAMQPTRRTSFFPVVDANERADDRSTIRELALHADNKKACTREKKGRTMTVQPVRFALHGMHVNRRPDGGGAGHHGRRGSSISCACAHQHQQNGDGNCHWISEME